MESRKKIPSRATTRSKGYRRGPQPKYVPYTFRTSSETKQLFQDLEDIGCTPTEIARAVSQASADRARAIDRRAKRISKKNTEKLWDLGLTGSLNIDDLELNI